jgi:adenylate cyclase
VAPEGVERKLAAILSADVVGYSRLMAEDEAATIRTLTDYREVISTLIRQHRGRVVDSPGDNLLAEFPTALDAVQSAVEIQRVIGARNADLPAERRMEFRIGVHLGDISVEGERVYGDGVNVAARLEGLAQPGGVCISGTVYEQVERKLTVDLEDLGEQTLKNIPRPVHVYGVKLLLPEAQREASEQALPGMDELTVPGFGGRPAIAVLPFENLSGDPEQEYFADGIAEDLITRLSSFPWNPVIARNSSFVYKGKAVDVKQVSRELGVRYVVEGSVRKAGDRVRISAQLIDATTGAHVWAETFDRQLADIFALQDEITERLAGSMGAEVGRSEMARTIRRNPRILDAWECAQRGTWHFNRFTKKDMAIARSLYERAIELDPLFVWPHQAIAMSHYFDLISGWAESPSESVAEITNRAQRCAELDENSPLAQIALGVAYSLSGQRAMMIAAFERASQLNPSDPFPYAMRGPYLAWAGKADESTKSLERAMRLSPRDPYMFLIQSSMAQAHFGALRYEEAIAWLTRSKEAKPDYAVNYVFLAASLAHLGRTAEAEAAFHEALRLQPGFSLDGLRLVFSSAVPDYLERLIDGLRKAGLKE